MEAPISASQGAMRSLPGKLESLLSDPEKGLHKGEKNKIRALKGDLEELIAKYLVEPSEVEDPALTAGSWMKEARELSYDIHDFVDDLVSVDTHAKIQQTPRPKISRFQEKRNRHQEITDQISSFRTRVKEAIQQHKDHLCYLRKWPSSSAAALDGRLLPPPPLEGGLRLVGMGSSIEELSGWLAKDGKPERRVVSIVGVGGVGKTTLANQLYRKLGGQFQCRAFVRTTRKPDHRRLLTSILSQVRPHHPVDPWGVPNLVEKIKEYLQNKTYFIIIDDLCAPSTWDIVSRALPKGNYCTRILTTTEVEVVARICCADNSKYIYKKKPLSEDESKELFSNVISVHQSDQCPKALSEVHKKIIKKIGGLPLAIIIMASLLARQPASIEQWNYMMSLPNSYLIQNANLEIMRHILNLCYNSIPHYLKACMLYLSLYEEGSIILKDDLVKQWISEGFICAMEGNDKEKVARSYFDELVNRGLIQPVDVDSSDEVLSCTMHYMVLHLIRYISIEENFITAIDHSQTATRLADKVRRLGLHFGTEEEAKPPMSMRLSQVRSLAYFGSVRCMPSVTQFRFLRVLILKLWADPDETSYCNLSGIPELFRLRYLRIDACHVNVELPTHMQWLKDLVALQIEAKVTAVPSDIVDMPGLLYLSLPSEAHLPTGIGNMTSLRSLGYFDLSSNSEENVMDLGKLTNLQDLHLTCSTVQPADNLKNNMECLGLVLEKLSNLKCVTLLPAVSSDVNTHDDIGASSINISCNVLSSLSPASTYLQRLELFPRFCIFRNLPKWFGELHQLCILKIAVREISTEDIRILKALPALTALSLSVWTVPEGWIFIEEDGFLALRYFKFTCAAPCLAFVEGAISYAQRLKLRFNANRLEQYNPADAGFEHLSGLKEITVEIGGANADKSDLRAAENALLTAFKKHRSSTLIINLQWVHWIYHGDKKMGTSLQKKNYQTLPVKGVITDEQHGRKDKQVDSSLSPILMRGMESTSHPQNPDVSFPGRGKVREMGAPISASLGPMKPLVAKLDKLLLDPPLGCSSESIKGLHKDVKELSSFLGQLTEVEDPPPTAKCWMNEARDLSYDMEDYIDDLLCVQPAGPSLVANDMEAHKTIMAKVSEFSQYVHEVIERHKVYVLPDSGSSLALRRRFVSLGPMLPTPYEDIVIDGQMNELIDSLANDEDQQLKVVSVLGSACLGKTTLAGVLYNKLGKRYHCRAFIRVSKKPNMKRIFRDMLSQLQRQHPPQHYKEIDLIQHIKKFLQYKRYLIIIDDIWDASVWGNINHAFPKGSHGSRIVTTTQIKDVALACCCCQSEHVFEMKPMDEDISRKLFFNRLFGSESDCPEQFKNVLNGTVKICGGLPLATISIASLLANQPVITEDLLNHIHESLSSCFSASSTSERTRQALNLSFNNLPYYLKTCLMYLSMYPEGYTFCNNDLVKQWMAEGFIDTTEGQDMKKVAESYLHQLISRRFIQPIRINYNNEVLSCVVHDAVYDLIARESLEENFIAAIDYSQKNAAVSCKARRLSLLCSDARYAKTLENITESKVRSITFFGILESMPCITEFKLLRVLNLQLSDHVCEYNPVDLSGISELLLLRYLKIGCGIYIKLPTDGLQCLETLDITDAIVIRSSRDIILPHLLHLSLPFEISLLDWIGIGKVGRLNYLEDLHLTNSPTDNSDLEKNIRALDYLIVGHGNLRTVVVADGSTVKNTVVRGAPKVITSKPSKEVITSGVPLLQRFECSLASGMTFYRIPKWVKRLDNLCILKITVKTLEMDCVRILRGLRALAALSLYVRMETSERIIFDKAGFSALNYFKLRFMTGIAWIKFEKDAMPNLLKLKLVFTAIPRMDLHPYFVSTHTGRYEQYKRGDALIIIEHMPGLREVSAKFGGAAADVEYIKSKRIGISNDPSNPKINMQWVDGQSTRQKHQTDEILEADPADETVDISASGRSPDSLHEFTVDELMSATNNFSLILSGSHRVDWNRNNAFCYPNFFYAGYFEGKGNLRTGLAPQNVVVKCLNNDSEWLQMDQTELECLAMVRHPHLVRLLGFCDYYNHRMLVYEDMPRGNLGKYLSGHMRDLRIRTWLIRLKIAVEAAKGLAFLHEADKPMVHGDFKASNILLDLDRIPTVKLFGFRLAKENPRDKMAETDVYNFGVVLLQLLSGWPCIDKKRPGPERNLVEWSHPHLLSEDKLHHIMEPSMMGQYSVRAAWRTATTARQCLESAPEERPRMRDVVEALEPLLSDHRKDGEPRKTKFSQYFTVRGVAKLARRLAGGAVKGRGKANKQADEWVEEPTVGASSSTLPAH